MTMLRYTALVFILLVGCDQPKPKAKVPRREVPVPFEEIRVREIMPVADGGAYVSTYNSGLWYVRGTDAVRVNFGESLEDPGSRPYKSSIGIDIIPSIDGGAYASFLLEGELWYLREGRSFRVREATSLKTQAHEPMDKDKFFAMYIAEFNARQDSKEEQEHFAPDAGPEEYD